MKRIILFGILLLKAIGLHAQERIYIQTDKPYYAPGDTVWFRAHLMDEATGYPGSRSRFVYMELHDQQAGTLMQRMMIRSNEDGVFANALLLPKEIRGGVYTLVAYTQWMRNFGADSFCYQPLTVLGGLRVRGHRIPEALLTTYYNAKVSISGSTATKKSPMSLDIDIRDKEGRPLDGIYSISVTDYDVVKPDSVFGDIRQSLLRQRLCDNHDALNRIVFPYQEEQFITGHIKGKSQSKIKNPHLFVVNALTGQRHEFELGDSTRFALAVDNPDGCTYLLEATSRDGGTSRIKLMVDSLTFPQVKLPKYALSSNAADTAIIRRMSQTQLTDDGILLDEVVKTGTHRPIRTQISFKLGAPSFMLTEGHPKLKTIHNVETLLRTMNVRHGVTDKGFPYLKVLVHVVGDHGEHRQIPIESISPSDIKQLDMYRGFKSLNEPDIVVIQLKHGTMNRDMSGSNMVAVHQLGYSLPVDFYSPKYRDDSTKNLSDIRSTLYWNPKVKTDSAGKANVLFYASDVSKRYLVTIEGISDNGIVVHHQQVIE